MFPCFVRSIDYNTQYSEMYRSRTRIIGDSIEAFAKSKGYTRTHVLLEKKEQLLVGCIYVAVDRPKSISTIHNIMLPDREVQAKKHLKDHRKNSTAENGSPGGKESGENNSLLDPASLESQIMQEKDWAVVKPEYYIEDTRLERTHLLLSEEHARIIIHGLVVGVVGMLQGLSFAVSDVILPIQVVENPWGNEGPEKKKICINGPGKASRSMGNTSSTPDGALQCLELENIEVLLVVADPEAASDAEVTAVIDLASELDARCKSTVIVIGGLAKDKKGKAEKLKRIANILDGKKTVFVPGPGDDVPYMLPLIPPPCEVLGISDNCQVLSSPCHIRVPGSQMVFCDPISVGEVLRQIGKNKLPKLEDYFSAMEYLITAMHISPCAPDSCPVYPMASSDPFILQSVPDIVVAVSSSREGGTRIFEVYGYSVTLCVVPVPGAGILKVERGVADLIDLM